MSIGRASDEIYVGDWDGDGKIDVNSIGDAVMLVSPEPMALLTAVLALPLSGLAGALVAAAEARGVDLPDLSLAEMQAVNPAITDAVYDVLGVHNSVASRVSYGGTAPDNVRKQAKEWLKRLEKEQNSG